MYFTTNNVDLKVTYDFLIIFFNYKILSHYLFFGFLFSFLNIYFRNRQSGFQLITQETRHFEPMLGQRHRR